MSVCVSAEEISPFPNVNTDLSKCQQNAYMCCWTHSYRNGKDGRPGKNTDICSYNGDADSFAGDKEGAVHCHGFAWTSDPKDLNKLGQTIHLIHRVNIGSLHLQCPIPSLTPSKKITTIHPQLHSQYEPTPSPTISSSSSSYQHPHPHHLRPDTDHVPVLQLRPATLLWVHLLASPTKQSIQSRHSSGYRTDFHFIGYLLVGCDHG